MEKSYKHKASDVMHWLGLAMVAVYFGFGSMLYFSDYFNYMEENMRIIFGLFLYAFGFFRGVNWLQKRRDRKLFGKDFEENR
jgi:hypothetical protein